MYILIWKWNIHEIFAHDLHNSVARAKGKV